MENGKNIIDIYTTELSPKEKERLLMSYCDYVSLVCCLDEMIQTYGLTKLTEYTQQCYAPNFIKDNPWQIKKIKPEEQELFFQLINGKYINDMQKFGFVSVKHTASHFNDTDSELQTSPSNFKTEHENNTLPHRIERSIITYSENAMLSDTPFLVEGKYLLRYIGHEDQNIAEAFENKIFKQTFLYTLDMLAQYPENTVDIDADTKLQMQKETLRSIITAPYENMILDALSTLAETSHQIIRKTIGRRTGRNYLTRAEKEKMIPSAVHLQDYMNIRHLLHHQWDTLDSIGKFNAEEQIKNASIRRRFLDSYCTLCDKPLLERIKSYFAARNDFITLVQRLNPFLFIRQNDESNSKFIARIKQYRLTHPNKILYIETGLHHHPEKHKSFIKNLEKSIGNIEIIDKELKQIEDLEVWQTGFRARRKYIETYSDIEYSICQYALLSGKNLTPPNAWNWLKSINFFTPQEIENWAEYRKLRNTLSHKHTDNELNLEILYLMPQFALDAKILDERLNNAMPEIELVEGNIYRAVHQDGKTVDIDYEQKKILNVAYQRKISRRRQIPIQQNTSTDTPNKKKRRIYTEEYSNGASITLLGTNIVSFRLNNGITLDNNKNYLYYNDGTKVYFDNPDKIYIIYGGKEKIILDKNLTIIRFIKDGSSVRINRNEHLQLSNKRASTVGSKENLASETWLNPNGQKMTVRFQKKIEGIYLDYSDGTKILLKPNDAKIWHNDEKLTYANRKQFIETYDIPGETPPTPSSFLINKEKQL